MPNKYDYAPKYGDYYGIRQPISLPPRDSDRYHTVTDADRFRIDSIAYEYYKDPSLWWVIADVNGIANPLELQTGQRLRIPSYERVQML